MTLIVGLKCKNGIAMASDGQATGGSAGGPIRMPIQKIFKISENVLFGAAGSVGIIQKSREVIVSFSTQLNEDWNFNLMENVKQVLFGIYKGEIDRHKAFYQGTPQQDLKFAPLADVLLCKYTSKQLIIWHIAPDCSTERLEEIGYGCSGIGDIFAHTLLKNYLGEEIDIEKGKLVVYRVIKEAIEIGAFGLGEPVDIWTITDAGIKRINESELMALGDAYITWREMEREVFKSIYGDKK
ncbi:MAG: hypothetical protein DDT42_01752 [candidate division WS2 bacterium]|uniref:Proteasome subunit beta n=1 Tax=Psychracetigena formicireducens TaxID=2986056 RepID=A0A9E2F6Z9_PSYF1|nr:hypothetical protein [Candidatus Psychracetigena formicireducens]